MSKTPLRNTAKSINVKLITKMVVKYKVLERTADSQN